MSFLATAVSFVLIGLSVHGTLFQRGVLERRVITEFCAIPSDNNALWLQERVEELREMGEKARAVLLGLTESSQYWSCAHLYLTQLGDRRQIPGLRKVAADRKESASRRRVAVGYLGQLNDTESTAMIVDSLGELDNITIIAALGQLDDDRARETLRRLTHEDRSASSLIFVVRAIGHQKDVDATEALAEIVDAQKSTEVRDEALLGELVTALALIGSQASLRLAVDTLEMMGKGPYFDEAHRSLLTILETIGGAGSNSEKEEVPEMLARVRALERR